MPLRSLTVRYPTGGAEALLSHVTPEKGDEMTRNGDTWIVEEVIELEDGDTVVKLSPVEPRESPSIDQDETG